MRITDSRLRRLIRSVIIESESMKFFKQKNPDWSRIKNYQKPEDPTYLGDNNNPDGEEDGEEDVKQNDIVSNDLAESRLRRMIRSVLIEQLDNVSSEEDILNESKLAAFLLGAAAFLSPVTGHALDTNDVQTAIERNFPGVKAVTHIDRSGVGEDHIEIDHKGKVKKYDIPDLTGYNGSMMDKFLKKKLNDKKMLSYFMTDIEKFKTHLGPIGDSKYFNILYGSYDKGINERYKDTIDDLNACISGQVEIINMFDWTGSSAKIVVLYDTRGEAVSYFKFRGPRHLSNMIDIRHSQLLRAKGGKSGKTLDDKLIDIRKLSDSARRKGEDDLPRQYAQ